MILYFSKKTGRCIGTLHGRIHTDEQKRQVMVQPQDHTVEEIAVIVNEWKPAGVDDKGNTLFEPEWGDPDFWADIEEGRKNTYDLFLREVDGEQAIEYAPEEQLDDQPNTEVQSDHGNV